MADLKEQVSEAEEGARDKAEELSEAVHNVYIGQFFFLQTERAQAYFQISRLSYHSTYIRPNSLGLEENRENSIFASLKL